MQRFTWQWRGGTHVDVVAYERLRHLPQEIEILDRGELYAITDDVTKAERIVECLNYSEQMRRTT